MLSFEFRNISPQIILSSNLPAAWKVIQFHELIHVLYVTNFHVSSPFKVPFWSWSHSKASHF